MYPEGMTRRSFITVPAVLLLTACATSAPTEYHQAAGPAPMATSTAPAFGVPAFTPPGAGLYRPDARTGEKVPDIEPGQRRQPPKPPSREPGLWEADRPRASEGPPGWQSRDPIILGVRLPLELPESNDGEFIIYLGNVRACAVIAHQLLTTVMPESEIGKLKPNEARCLSAALWSICAVKDRVRLDLAAEGMEIKDFMRRAYDRNVTASKRFQEASCKDGAFSRRVLDWYTRSFPEVGDLRLAMARGAVTDRGSPTALKRCSATA
jgi:hypothetical protein